MKRYIKEECFRTFAVRICLLILVLLAPIRSFAVGWAPTDAGLIVKFEEYDQFLLSVWIDLDEDGVEDEGEEFFVCDIPSWQPNDTAQSPFNYSGYGNFFKLRRQTAGATKPSDYSIWTVKKSLTHSTTVPGEDANFRLDGICYTMWSQNIDNGNPSKTLVTTGGNFKFLGELTSSEGNANACDVAFAVPTVQARKNMDPDNTLGKGGVFDGATGVGFAGMVYREVYMFMKPRQNEPISYDHFGLVTVNRTKVDQKWGAAKPTDSGNNTVNPGKTAYIYSDSKHNRTTRTLFRLYIYTGHSFGYCPSTYFFAHDEQDVVKYRTNESKKPAAYTAEHKIYTIDHHHCMERVASTSIYKTDPLSIPADDSTYYYIGKNQEYYSRAKKHSLTGTDADSAFSQFRNIRRLRVKDLADAAQAFIPEPGAYGQIVVDTTTKAENLGATFEPAGYFLKVSSGKNIRLIQTAEHEWTTEEVWTITPAWANLQIKATLFTGDKFSEDDPGADIRDWSRMVTGTSIPLSGSAESVVGKTGRARIYTNRTDSNGGLEFFEVDSMHYVRYHNNGHFGSDIPDQYAVLGNTRVMIQEPRLMEGYKFIYWTTVADTTGVPFTKYVPGTTVDLESAPVVAGKHVLDLYAQAAYTGAIHVAISFLKDGKRYFMTNPGQAPRYARARNYKDWTNVWQGMSDINNTNSNYLSTYKIVGQPTCQECNTDEYVLDPHRETMHGSEDSLVFYDKIQPADAEYIGLYFDTVPDDVILSNNTWAGLFVSSKGWPSPVKACVDSTRLSSSNYLTGFQEGSITKKERKLPVDPEDLSKGYITLPPNIKYNAALNQFDGVVEGDSTSFMISGVGVVDAHYVILPDTTDNARPWKDSITFGYHQGSQTTENVWSQLIGKHLLAQMKVGEDTIYFHPNNDQTETTAAGLSTSTTYRLTHAFEYIRDARVEALHTVMASDKPVKVDDNTNGFHCTITSGQNTPIDVKVGGVAVDIVDTLRVWLRPAASSRIKDYYGRWSSKDANVHIRPDGSRYRDIIVTTKTYHYGDTIKTLRLLPEKPTYSVGSLKDVKETVRFKLELITSHQLLDTKGQLLRIDTISVRDTTSLLHLTSETTLRLKESDIFSLGTPTANSVQLTTLTENITAPNRDTLFVTTHVTLGSETKELEISVPLMQVSTQGQELIWSIPGTSYFIMGSIRDNSKDQKDDYDSLRIQTLSIVNSRLVRNNTELIIGSYQVDGLNNRQHIRGWKWTDIDVNNNQLTLKTEYGINKWFHIKDETTPEANGADSTILTFVIDTTYTNANGNYEELVYLKYGATKWLKFNSSTAKLELTTDSTKRTLFSWAYMLPEYNLLNNGTYPNPTELVFGYDAVREGQIQTPYKAYLDHSMLLHGQLIHVAKTEETNVANLINKNKDWKTSFTSSIIPDARVATPSGLSLTRVDTASLTTYIASSGPSPRNVQYKGEYVNIVDTLDFRITLRDGAPTYRFKDKWSSFSSVEDAHLKIPLVRLTFYTAPIDTVIGVVEDDDYNFAFPSTLRSVDSLHTFTLKTERRVGTRTYDVNGELIDAQLVIADSTNAMDLTNIKMSEARLIGEYGDKPDWCKIESKTKNTITIKCLSNGIRSPRMAYIYFAYVIIVDGKMRFVNYRLTVSQSSLFDYANNQKLVHTAGASGDKKMADGRQQVHENTRVLYYYNPKPYNEPDQNVELPVRERGFYGWWRWYREGKDQNRKDVSDSDIPDTVWYQPPRNVGGGSNEYKYAYRIIGDSVKVYDEEKGDSVKVLMTMGRYTVFFNPSKKYGDKWDPPAKSPMVYPPFNKDTMTYVVDISNYTDNLPLSMAHVNQIDTAMLEKMKRITEPTLSLREIFELHPWTEMAARLDTFKTPINAEGVYPNDKYMEDHVVRAPIGNALLLKTEQRYNYKNLQAKDHSESLLGYYMRDDNWDSWSANPDRQDTMIWCGGWDADCIWYTYNPSTHKYTQYGSIPQTLNVDEDFLMVEGKGGITAGHEFDTVYYCLRARSKATSIIEGKDSTVAGNNWFNICRYKIIYHEKTKYGPLEEGTNRAVGSVKKAILTNDEIEQDYEVLERLNFDYNEPGADYTVYPHPLPWADCSYGYTYPLSSSLPHNRYHDQADFPGPGEYGIINRVPYDNEWWRSFEQHGGAENGYMIYCDGMSSSGQVAALSLKTNLCEGQKLYFSGYVGNINKQKGKSNPNFTFSVQGKNDKSKDWEDISSFMTGDLPQSANWYQIFFPIEHEQAYDHFRVRIFNMAATFDGNDFIIDDMCIFATKPPLIAYQAQTKCVESNESDSIIHVVLRVDYQGFIDSSYNNSHVYYTVEKITKDSTHSFVPMIDKYINDSVAKGIDASKPDTVFGWIPMPRHDYDPDDNDSIFTNLNELAARFEQSIDSAKIRPDYPLFRRGYIYENLDGDIRPVLYVVHKAKMTADNTYKVRMSLGYRGLLDSKCAMTSNLKVTNRMMLMLNGEEQVEREVDSICGNATYDLSLRVRGTLIQDSVAPIDLTGTCKNDWLLYGDTAEVSSETRYGYCYSDIVKVVKDILRYEPMSGESNINQFASNLGSVNKNVMENILKKYETKEAPKYLKTDDAPYTVLSNLVNKGFLLLYKSDLMVSIGSGDSAQYVIFPILGSGSDDMQHNNMEVCPTPLVIKLKSKPDTLGAPIIIGGLHRDSTMLSRPVIVNADVFSVAEGIAVPIDSIRTLIGVRDAVLIDTDDPNFREGVHILEMAPDRKWPDDFANYYEKGDTMILTPSSRNNYTMRQGYKYTYNLEMVTPGGDTEIGGCPIGNVPFTISYVPDYLRWDPKNAGNNQWNDPNNWIGVNAQNKPIHDEAHFVPLASTNVVIPAMPDSLSYPILPASIGSKDSVQEVGFAYNTCDSIRFLPGAAIGQQQNLTYNEAVIDMSVPYGKWALRSSPVKGMVSGDVFMANADLTEKSNPWIVGEFDADGRNYSTGNASFWLSVYCRETVRKGNGDQVADTARVAVADWSKVTNALTLPLPAGQGWAIYAKTKSEKDAVVRLPKKDDRYYYFYKSGGKNENQYEDNIQDLRNKVAGGSGAGKFAYYPKKGDAGESYTITNDTASTGSRIETTSFIFGNPTMAYIDIWGFIADNSLQKEFRYIGSDGNWKEPVTEAYALTTTNAINTIERYLPPMQAIEVHVASATYTKTLALNTNRIVTDTDQVVRPALTPAPKRASISPKKGIMTVTAINSVSPRCVSRLLLGQGYHDAILIGEDAMLTTVNIDNYSNTSYPATPFNIYAVEDGYGLSVDLRDSITIVPLSFFMSDLPFDPVTHLWFTGVQKIGGKVFLYDALTETERPIIDGICLDIETPTENHQVRYYIRRYGPIPTIPDDPDPDDPIITTDYSYFEPEVEQAVKIIYNGHVLIKRNGHIYTMFGQKVK